MNRIEKIIYWYFSKRALPYWGVLMLDCAVLVLSGMVAFYWAHSGTAIASVWWRLLGTFIFSLPFFWVGMRLFHTYSGIIRYSSFIDLLRVAVSNVIGFLLFALILKIVPVLGMNPVRLGPIELLPMFVISTVGMCALRVVVKTLYDSTYKSQSATGVFIYGVQQGGVSIAKSMRNQHPQEYVVEGFVTSDKHEVGRFLLDAKIHSSEGNIVAEMQKKGATALFVSPLCSDEFRENTILVDALMSAGISIMMMPAAQSWDGKNDLSYTTLRPVDIEDLLPRDKIEVDMDAIGELLKGRKILITGAAGSIGSEMVRQIALYAPAELILIDEAETPMHDMRLYLKREHPEIKAWTLVTSITNAQRMEAVFAEHRPDYVFHAAAYKHVPMMEDNPSEAVQNNIGGTRIVADMAVKYGTKKFVMISTDKAVNPTNVMGCSKRICEIYCQSLDWEIKRSQRGESECKQFDGSPAITQFVTTRFGNVLGSNGSVIPLFKEQIRQGGPVTVTDRNIVRFFMLIPEACKLVLEAGTKGNGGEIFVFDMGEPVKIVDLAKRMIKLSGAQNIEIKFTGLRDGEKLYEEVLSELEGTKPSFHKKIRIAEVRKYGYKDVCEEIDKLIEISKSFDDMETVRKMKMIVPEYKSNQSVYEVLDAEIAQNGGVI